MAKYTISYACGHGTFTDELRGKNTERQRKIEWLERNKVCPECFKEKMRREDAEAEKAVTVRLVPGLKPVIALEAKGQIERNKEALYSLGYRWSDSSQGGLMGYFSLHRPKRVLALLHQVESVADSEAWLQGQKAYLKDLGYALKIELSELDYQYISHCLQKKQAVADATAEAKKRLDEIKASDPRPKPSPLRMKIGSLEKETGSKWNGKIYGSKGNYSFYVNNVKHSASDEEVEEREKINAAMAAWDEKYKDVIGAAK